MHQTPQMMTCDVHWYVRDEQSDRTLHFKPLTQGEVFLRHFCGVSLGGGFRYFLVIWSVMRESRWVTLSLSPTPLPLPLLPPPTSTLTHTQTLSKDFICVSITTPHLRYLSGRNSSRSTDNMLLKVKCLCPSK